MTSDPAAALSPEFTESVASVGLSDLQNIAHAYGDVDIASEPLANGTWGYSVTIKFTNPELASLVATSNPESSVAEAYRSAIVLAEYIKLQKQEKVS